MMRLYFFNVMEIVKVANFHIFLFVSIFFGKIVESVSAIATYFTLQMIS